MFGNLATSLKSNTVGRIYSIRKILFQSLLPFHFISMHPGRCHVLSLAHPYWTISATTQSHNTHAISFDYRVSTGHSVIIWRLLVRKTKLYSFVSTIKQSTLITQSLVVININYYSLFCKVRLLSESFHLLCPAFLLSSHHFPLYYYFQARVLTHPWTCSASCDCNQPLLSVCRV